MPELPDITVYQEALERRVAGQVLEGVSVASPFLLRTVDPPLSDAVGRTMIALERIGKRLVFALEGELFLVLHLMIAGRLKWFPPGAKGPGRITLARFDFPEGRLVLTEAGTKRRASLHVVRGRDALQAFDRGGLEPLEASLPEFAARLRLENHTVKRALTDPRLFSGIGNAYSDEILHAARLSPLTLTRKLSDDQIARLFAATRKTLEAWIVRIREETGAEFPEKVTAFREGMAVHGRFGRPCPTCGSPVQRIRYADNETNYCARCQTDGKLLADRALSRLLKSDWPRTLDELE
jgi:formamidopyrimidine-DNA glycosylase